MDRCPLWTGVCYGQVSVVDRYPLWTGVRYGEFNDVDTQYLAPSYYKYLRWLSLVGTVASGTNH